MWGKCKIVNFSWLLFSTLVIGQNLLTQKNTLSTWSVNAFYCVNGLHVGLYILCVKIRTFLCGESTVVAKQKKLLSTLPGSLFKSFHIRRLQKHLFSHTNPYILNVTQQCWWSYFELGLPVLKREPMRFKLNITFLDFIFFCLGDVQICRHFDTSFVFFFSPICRIYSINRPGHFLNV